MHARLRRWFSEVVYKRHTPYTARSHVDLTQAGQVAGEAMETLVWGLFEAWPCHLLTVAVGKLCDF